MLDEVVANANEVKTLMNEISISSEEQAEGINNISTAMNQLDETTHLNSQSARETSQYSSDLAEQVLALNHITATLHAEVLGANSVALSAESKEAAEVPAKKEATAKILDLKPNKEESEPITDVTDNGYPASDDSRFG